MDVLTLNWNAFRRDLQKVAAQNKYRMTETYDPTSFAEILWHLQSKCWSIGGWLWARLGRDARQKWSKYGKEKRIRFKQLSDIEKKQQTSEAERAFGKYKKEINAYDRDQRYEKYTGNLDFHDMPDIEDHVKLGNEEYLSPDVNENNKAMAGIEVAKKHVRFQEPMGEETGYESEIDNASNQLGGASDFSEVHNTATQTGRLEILPVMSIHFSEEIQTEKATRPKIKLHNRKNGEFRGDHDANGNEMSQTEMDFPDDAFISDDESRISNEDDRVLYGEDNAHGQHARPIGGTHIRATNQSSYSSRYSPTYSNLRSPQVPMYYDSGYSRPSSSHAYYAQPTFQTNYGYSYRPWNNNDGNATEAACKRLILVDPSALLDHINDFLGKGLLPQAEIERTKSSATREEEGRTYKTDRGSKNNNNSDDDCGMA
ncbi:hypothetical protein DdX_21094 [Ditylenchus destructor]|uniref:Uncharacterized protein n=1 Tax=Ditylenchus destructor TaxID=166010 RepID=A0AAD4MH07_9BILA|nr:hypothetical protein DdX_21094 [Ditylenchus destructor]